MVKFTENYVSYQDVRRARLKVLERIKAVDERINKELTEEDRQMYIGLGRVEERLWQRERELIEEAEEIRFRGRKY